MNHTSQTVYSDPGAHAALLDALPADVPALTAAVRNLLIHYRGGGIAFTGDRYEEINHRWVEAMLTTDQRRNGTPLTAPREPSDRIVGCCRDYALLTISALRQRGVPARSRVGFASYFGPGFNHDHVVLEYWNGRRWVLVDPGLEPGPSWAFDPQDLEPGWFRSAAEVWLGYRDGSLDGGDFGVDPSLPLRGGWFIRNYVVFQLAHLQGDELLLWDLWGAMSDQLGDDPEHLELIDEIATLLVAYDNGDAEAGGVLAARYAADPRLRPGRTIVQLSPAGDPPVTVDLSRRAVVEA
ncbi:transglutaminase-like domain-containing protein [Kribbella sp. CA-293567]|uniref:transglutaminase-like domain-containing protein n=1 Tax=Kribbella sp. CA-293567 TaxID=3002436 RepID=UPI0022DCE4B7|nr:transglutaminase-like domain-containing protein [Kribbella sp. CA-293567]WBQ07505.1 transglutaminase-like domain-containing protein [Kribbella sp. CA-293567]